MALAKVIIGTNHADVLTGTKQADTMRGRGGPDNMYGYRGADVMFGGPGRDTLYGNTFGIRGSEPDRLEGGDGNDSLYGGAGGDRILGNAGDDHLIPSPKGATKPDVVFGGAGRDDMSGGTELHGGSGPDRLSFYYENQTVRAYGGTGQDFIEAKPSEGIYRIYAVDGERDVVQCTDVGQETVEADVIDDVRGACDTVNRH